MISDWFGQRLRSSVRPSAPSLGLKFRAANVQGGPSREKDIVRIFAARQGREAEGRIQLHSLSFAVLGSQYLEFKANKW